MELDDFPGIEEYARLNEEWLTAQPESVQRKYIPRGTRYRTPRGVRSSAADDSSELHDAIQATERVDFAFVAPAGRAINRLSKDRAERYETWIAVGMALSQLGRIGYAMWDEWSRISPKYTPGACADKWPTFTPGDGLTIAHLDIWANEDDPRDDPTDGCGPDCPNRARLHDHQATITQLTAENSDLRAHNQFVSNTQSAPGVKSASLRDTVVELKKELDRVPVEEREPDQFVRIRPALMASYTNSSPSTISRHLKRLEDRGIIERHTSRSFDTEHELWISETFVRPCVDLTDPTVLVIPSEHGGKRKRCPACLSENLVREIRVYCADCEETIEQHVDLVNTVSPPELQDAIQESAPPLNDHSPLNCIPSSNRLTIDVTPAGQSTSELQDAIQDSSELQDAIQAESSELHLAIQTRPPIVTINSVYRHLWPRPSAGL
jgi:DNA-binding transcriptional ArsR family regulator